MHKQVYIHYLCYLSGFMYAQGEMGEITTRVIQSCMHVDWKYGKYDG